MAAEESVPAEDQQLKNIEMRAAIVSNYDPAQFETKSVFVKFVTAITGSG